MRGPGIHQVREANSQIPNSDHEVGPDTGEGGLFQHGEQKAKLGVTESGTRGKTEAHQGAAGLGPSSGRRHQPQPRCPPDHAELAQGKRRGSRELWVAIQAWVVADFKHEGNEGGQELLTW